MFKQSIKEALILVGLACVVALIAFVVRPDLKFQPESRGPVASPPAKDQLAEISLEDAWQRFQTQAAVFADARHRADYDAGHIRGAVHLYALEPDDWLGDLLADTDPSAQMIAYCDGEDCRLATDLAELLTLNGFENVYYLKNGWTRWRERGLPVE